MTNTRTSTVLTLDDPASDEDARVRAAEENGMFDSGPEPRFDRITTLAMQLFDVPIATISLMGRHRQCYLSAPGIEATSIPREDSFCDHTVRAGATVLVPDMTRDARFAANPFVRQAPRIRFYAGEPLRSPEGQVIGTLCLMDLRPRDLTPGSLDALRELARWAEAELHRSVELDRAAEVQRGLLPSPAYLAVPGHQLAAVCVPSRTVGGDLVDFYLAPDGSIVFTLGDVMGKGIGAAIMMATVRAAMRTAGRLNGPAEAVRQAAATLEEDLQRTGTLVTLCHARLNPMTGAAAFTDAGHGLFLSIRDGRIVPRLSTGGLPLGVVAGDTWPERTATVRPGDTLVAFSDGLLELFDSIGSAYEEVLRVVVASPDAATIVDHFGALARGRQLTDDVTMLALRRY